MKKLFKSNYFKWGLTAFLVVVAATVFYFIVGNIGSIFDWIGALIDIMMSLIIGLVIAYILNPIVGFFEKKVYKKVKKQNARRNLSIATTIVIVLIVISAVFSLVIPQLIHSISELINNSDNYVKAINSFLKSHLSGGKNASNFNKLVNKSLSSLKSDILPSASAGLSSISTGITGFVSGLFNTLIGFVFAVYILANTNNFASGTKKVLYAFFNTEKVNHFVEKVGHINNIFLKFMIGKVTDSSIVCLCTLVFLLICGFPYPVLIAIIIGLTDLIPYFGPYIGTVPSALLLAVVDPLKALIFIIFIICLQQIDSNLITPRIQSSATGLPSFWVLFAIMLFGGLFGVVGLLIGVPCFTIIYEIVCDFIDEKLKDKKLPVDKDYYEENDTVKVKE